jgi:glycine cleavage system H protein
VSVSADDFPADRWYQAREHLWCAPAAGDDGGPASVLVTVGLDALGAELLGEVVYVELPGAGRTVARGEALGSLEAEKMVRPLLAPLSGTVVEVNPAVLATPRLLNRDPYGAGWLVRLRAARWDAERRDLLHGEAAVAAWARAEIEAHR